jgi:multidrug efflux pump subunit AcrA (membrane-fusion protein)
MELRNTDLDVEMERVTGDLAGAQEQLLALDRAIFDEGKRMQADERNRMAGQRAEVKQKIAALELQLNLLRTKRQKLKVLSPVAGEVTTWNVDEMLQGRPVRQGQVLLRVAETAGDWELELRLAEDQAGYLAEARQHMSPDLQVTYRLATDPGIDHHGTITEVHLVAEPYKEEGNTVLVRVAIDKSDLTYLRPGADVMAKIKCGERSLGYVWFHDVINFIHSRILFKL